ncbi:Zn-ribbon domain-containing OB-fold protein [Rhodococcus sp. 06-418-5]|jgi:hypothetical protein|uniref:Zn-ribbon domain-containing OB-fold protein n=1 Tax=Rhodococcus sp. 06-418-5 TaxID=2022507 RepID=UPI001C52EAF8|nr:Zn-ribbon domain-containing OB-fold protein [Rhodococcus sp. 06-418-5]
MTGTIEEIRGKTAGVKRPRAKMAPSATPETRPYWDAAADGRLSVQRCRACAHVYFYPRDFCPVCSSDLVEWIDCSGRATLYSYVIEHRPGPGFENDGPYVVAVVQLEEGPRMMTNIVGVEPLPENLPLDMEVTVQFEPRGEMWVPVFAPAGASA